MEKEFVTFLKNRTRFSDSARSFLCDSVTSCFVATLSPDMGCIHCYPKVEWENIANRISWLPDGHPTVRTLKHRLLSHAVIVEMSEQGWVTIPGSLKIPCDIKNKGVLVRKDKNYELWNPESVPYSSSGVNRNWIRSIVSRF